MLTIYGNDKLLSDNMISSLNKFLSINNSYFENNDAFIYKGYPCEPNNNDILFIKLIIVIKTGIYYVLEGQENKSFIRKSIMSTCINIDSIMDKYDSGTQICIAINHLDLEKLLIKEKNNVLDEEEIQLFNSHFQKSRSLTQNDDRAIINEKSLGNLIKKRNTDICDYDTNQFETIYESNIKNHIRIRGLAGSGKTIILVKKMAYMHYLHPELKMCYVFFTISLKQYIQNLFQKFYLEFNSGKKYDETKIRFFHCWGTKEHQGFYSYICDEKGKEKESLIAEDGTKNSYSSVCNRLLESLPSEKLGLFDYIFIDEAQDFGLSFFKLALKTLNAEGKIIYAYDELQTLYNSSPIPTPSVIFGNEVCCDYNLPICYRTPKEILVTAHALGMGIYSDDGTGLCNIPEDLSIWSAIGYESDQPIKLGEQVKLYRNPSKIDIAISDPIVFKIFSNKEEEYIELSKSIYSLIKNEDVLVSDILIIDMDSLSIEDNYYQFKEKNTIYLNRIAKGKERAFAVNLVNKDNAYRFRLKDSIPYTTVFRAKGNESNIVYILNADKMLLLSTCNRNRLFTAMTRAKFKVFIYGMNAINQYVNEYELVKKNNYSLDFKYPSKKELENLKTVAANEEKNYQNYTNVLGITQELKNTNAKLFNQLLLAQTGCKSIEELMEYLENEKNKES